MRLFVGFLSFNLASGIFLPAPALAGVHEEFGTIIEVRNDEFVITKAHDPSDKKHFHVGHKTEIWIGGRSAWLPDLQPGMQVTVLYKKRFPAMNYARLVEAQ